MGETCLTVGTRVRIGPKACDYPWCGWWEDDDDTMIAEGEVGILGWVPDPRGIDGHPPSVDGHDYGVKLDKGIAWFRSTELELLED